MIWLLGYLVIGMAFAIYLPIKMARSRARVEAISKADRAAMCEHQQDMLEFATDVVKTRPVTWQIVLAGLLWPTQIASWIGVEIYFAWRRGRRS